MSELVINESNFNEYFRDVRLGKPEKGDIIARYTAMAELHPGRMKSDIIDLISNKNKAKPAVQVMRKLGSAVEGDAIRICKEICRDLAVGMTVAEVEAKIYSYQLEFFYFTKQEFVPLGDPHWSVISITNLDEFLDKSGQRLKIKGRVLPSDETV